MLPQPNRSMDCSCPLCGTEAEYTIGNREGGTEIFTVQCAVCLAYKIVGWQTEVLDEIGADGRKLISEFNRRIQENNGISTYRADSIKRTVYSQEFAEKATALYGLRDAQVAHSGGFDGANMLFIADAGEDRFTLRVYSAAHGEARIRSQLYWMHALQTEAGLQMPSPLRWPDGALFRKIEIDGAPDPRCCVLFRWVEGERMEYMSREAITPRHSENYGAMVARMHAHAQSFETPDWFEAPRYDQREFRRKLAEGDLDSDRLPEDAPQIDLQALGKQILDVMEAMGEGPDMFGLVHGDITDSNTLFCGDDPRPVDFQSWGWGYYLADLVKAMRLALEPAQYHHFLRGYRRVRALPEAFDEWTEILMKGRFLERHWF